MGNIFITGGTGFLGSSLICEILHSSNDNIYALVRGNNAYKARKRMLCILGKISTIERLDRAKKERIHVYVGDITRKNLGLTKKDLSYLVKNIDSIYHCAAITNLNIPLKKIRKINVDGTRKVLNFAYLCKIRGKLHKVNHISTAYVVGTKICTFKERDLNIGQSFNNPYEQSKYEAEQLVRKYRKRGLNISVFRPSIMLGRYKDGVATKFKMLYQPLHFLSFELIDKLPIIKEGKPNLINVDIAAKAIYSIASSKYNKNGTYHITSSKAPTLPYILGLASEYFGFENPQLLPPNCIDMHREYTPVKRKIIEPYLPYFNYLTKFDMKNTLSQLEREEFIFPKLNEKNFIRLFEYCNRCGFIKRKKRHVVIR